MARSLNRATLIGNVGKPPEVRSTQTGGKVVNFSLATNEQWNDKSGAKQEKTEWHNITVFGKLADIAERFLTQGASVFVEGKLTTEKWTDKEGNARYSTKIVLGFDGKLILLGKSDSPGQREEGDTGTHKHRGPTQDMPPAMDAMAEDIPF